MMIRVRTCHHEIGIRSIRATTSSIEPPPDAMLSLAFIIPSPILFLPPPPCGEGIRSNELQRDAAELAEVGVQRIAFARMDHAGE